MHKPLRTLVSAAVIGVLATSAAHAGGFSLYTESSPAATGNFGAGIAAEGGDASIGWYNPAGLVLIQEQQAVFGGVGVFPKAELSGVSTFRGPAANLPAYTQSFTGLNGGENAFVPAFHYALPLGENATFGLSMVSPFGLSTDWGIDSPVRYQATYTELITTNVSPEIGGKLTENFSLGAGLDLQFARVKFNRVLGLPTLYGNPLAIPESSSAMGADSLSYNKGHSFGVGFHAGVLAMSTDKHTRVGLNYQSKMKHTFHGYSRLSGRLAGTSGNVFMPATLDPTSISRSNELTSNNIELPDVVTLSAYRDVNEKLALLGSVVYTGWGVFKTIQLNNVQAPAVSNGAITPLGTLSQAHANSTSTQNYKDAWRFAVGANYHLNPQWMLRVGGGYDATPTNDVDRDVRLPDTDRWALSVGAHYQMKPNIGIDVGYTHLFAASNPTINKTDAITSTSSYGVVADGKARADLVGIQAVWTMDHVMPQPTK
ncbi:OmpP1/FadL family transporter [Legionella shakespearei]|uniref:Long chain fatty acid transporter n=1 Tax=Legionella shakespearei DSM 23087 TaxID=1122169 RepID=A0A0W0Z7E6_9GAMM|nr:OmpP1/FadL family transporter [Legionella shakespearei]KTD65042.1 long chain fatty acid transporter [Legionella shakespearei DSM 23087]